jgi:NitT/TauT family transport system substrate-binding protein
MTAKVDAVTLEVIGNALPAVANEMRSERRPCRNRTREKCDKIRSRKRETRGEGMIAAMTGLGLRRPVLDHRTCDELGGLPLPSGERAGVRGFGTTDKPEPLTPPLSLREREQTECAVRHVTQFPLRPAHRRKSARQQLGALFLASAVLSAGVLTTASAETLRVGKAGRDAFSFVPADIGARTGIFRQQGVDIEISSFGGDARLQQAMAADGIDVGLGSGPGLAFVVKGSPVKGIAAMAGPPLLFALVVRNDAAVASLDDLRGRKVGVSTVGSVTSWIISEVSRQKGWGYDGMAQVPIGDDANRIAALKTRSLDGAIVNLAQALNFVQRGEGKVLLRFGELVKDFHIHVIFATDKAIAGKPEALRGFLKGWLQTIAFMRKERNATVEVAKDVMGTDAQTTNAIYDELMPMFSDTGRFDPNALSVLRKSFVEMKTLPEEPDMSKLYTEAFLPTN